MLLPLIAVATMMAASGPDSLVYHGRAGRINARPTRITVAPSIDGRLDEAEWQTAALLTGFSEYTPVDKLPAEDSTEVRVMYTDHDLYIGIRALEKHGPVNASLADRDKVLANDYVRLDIDTFDDKRRALVFMVNPLGVQADGILSETGTGGDAQLDLNPDFVFHSRGRVTNDGYEVELRIPFKSLRYQSKQEQQWGFQVVRAVQHSGHRQTWTMTARGAQSFLAQAGLLVGLTGLRRGLVMDVTPVVTSRVAGADDGTTGRWAYQADTPEFGGTVRWGITENLTLNATANPDFSQVEADAGQIQYDPRQALFFAEKRPFFLEANENFAIGNSLIYTRAIAAPVAAAKLSGKVSGINVGFLSAVDDRARSTADHNPVFNILRLRRDVAERSNVGLVYTDRVDGDNYNRVAGMDTRLVRGAYTLSAQYAASFSREGQFGATAAPLFDIRLGRSGRDWGFNSVLSGIHPDFVAASGFISRTGVARASVTPRRSWYGKPGAWLEQYSLSNYNAGIWDYDRFRDGTIPNDIQLHLIGSAQLRGGWYVQVQPWIESFKYPAELYRNFYIAQQTTAGVDTVPYVGTDRISNYGGQLTVNTPQFKKFSGSANITLGRDVNFAEWAEGWILFTDLSAQWRPTEKLRVDGNYVEQRFHRVTDRSLVTLRQIPRVKVEYQISRPVFVRMVSQYDATRRDALRDDSRTNAPILQRRVDGTYAPVPAISRGSLRSDWLFSYQPNPGTVVFAGYGNSLSNQLHAYSARGLEKTSDEFFVKVSYLFRL